MAALLAKQARKTMVDTQIRPNDVTDLTLLDAFYTVPREHFVPANLSSLAYMDKHQALLSATKDQRYLISPMALAKLLALLEFKKGDKILVVGANTGYSAAILHHAGARVVALEENLDLLNSARKIATDMNLKSIEFVEGALKDGAPSKAPFDAIFIEGAIEISPDVLLAQLKPHGTLVCVKGSTTAGRACVYKAGEMATGKRETFNVSVPLLSSFAAVPEFSF